MASSSRFLQALKTSPHCLRVLTTFLEIVLARKWVSQNIDIVFIELLFLMSHLALRSSMVPLVPSQQLNTRTHKGMTVQLFPLTCSQWLSLSHKPLMHQHTLHSRPNTTERVENIMQLNLNVFSPRLLLRIHRYLRWGCKPPPQWCHSYSCLPIIVLP